MAKALLRNIYMGEESALSPPAEPAALWLADYLAAQINHLAELPTEEVRRGRFSWAPLPPHAP